MKNINIFIILISFQFTLNGQIKYSVGASLDHVPINIKRGNKTLYDLDFHYSIDSTKFTYKDTRNIDFKTIYKGPRAYKFYTNIHIPIFKKTNLITGLGLDFHPFYVNTIYTKIDKTTELIKTEKVSSIPDFWNPFRKTYSINDEYSLANSVLLINLYIPIGIDFEIFNNFRIFSGLKFNYVFYSTYTSFSQTRTISPNGFSSITARIKDHSGDAIFPFSLEGFAGIKYRLFDKYELSISANKYFTGILREPQHNLEKNIYQKVDFLPYSPARYTVGINYFFNNWNK